MRDLTPNPSHEKPSSDVQRRDTESSRTHPTPRDVPPPVPDPRQVAAAEAFFEMQRRAMGFT